MSLSVAMSEDLWLLLVANCLHGYCNHHSGGIYALSQGLCFLHTLGLDLGDSVSGLMPAGLLSNITLETAGWLKTFGDAQLRPLFLFDS